MVSDIRDIGTAPTSIDYALLDGFLPPSRKLDFGLDTTATDGGRGEVREVVVAQRPFCTLLRFARMTVRPEPKLLVVAPLSGHLSILVRDMVLALLPGHDVYVTDWINAREVPRDAPAFGLDDNIDYILDFARRLGPDVHLIGLCQSAVPVLAAAALLAEQNDRAQPSSITLIAGPVDSRIQRTRVGELLAAYPLDRFERSLIATVPPGYAGAGRRVYPGFVQLTGLIMHLARHVAEHGELLQKFVSDDGADPVRFPFRMLYTTVMDLAAELVLDQIRVIFQDAALPQKQLVWRGHNVDLAALRHVALTTVEGENDDIVAPGQTLAAHALCPNIPARLRRHHLQPGVGHFGTFHGRVWRSAILPVIRETVRAAEGRAAGAPNGTDGEESNLRSFPGGRSRAT